MKWTQISFRMFCVIVTVLTALAIGCGGDDGIIVPEDSAMPDGTIVDGGELDSSPSDVGLDAAFPDAPPPTCNADCDPRLAEACGDAGVCALATAAPACESVLGTKARGASCETPTDCLAGLACFGRLGGGVCAEVCCPAEGVCEGEERCTGSGTLVDGTDTEWWSCVGPRSCDVLDPSAGCEVGEGCYIVSPEGDTDCRRGGTALAGADCVGPNDCAPGYFCAGVTGGTCARICEIGATRGALACPPEEGNCQAYPYSPADSGICTVDTTMSRFR